MSPRPSAEHLRALAMLLLANFFWGLSFPLIKAIMLLHGQIIPEAGSWFSAAYTVAPRFLIAVVVMFALRPHDSWRANAREWRQGAILGLFAAAGMLLQNDALQHTPASTSAFLTQFYAILIPIWIALRGRQNPGARIWLCCALVLVGVAILGRFDPVGFFPSDGSGLQFGRGEWETLLCSLFFMGQILTLERKDFAGNRPEKITFVMFLVEALIFWVLAGFTTPDLPTLVKPWLSLPWVVFTLALTVFCTLGSFSLMNAWQPKITATEAGLIYCVEPIFASVMALFLPAVFSAWAGIHYPNETATWTLLVGGGLVTLANVILQVRPPTKA